MKPVYSNLDLLTGFHKAGICKIQIAPKDWLQDEIQIDWLTNNVITPIVLTDSNQWITFALAPNTVEFLEKPKASKAGIYYDISLSGLANQLNPAILQSLETLRSIEFVIILTGNFKQKRLIGTKKNGAQLSIGSKNRNGDDPTLEVAIDFSYQSSRLSPFYTV